jgi:hypothetical protein
MDLFNATVDLNNPNIAGGVALLYSGGCDSTLAACRLATYFPKVSLVTYNRMGFISTGAPSVHYERMALRFPDVEFTHELIPYQKFYEKVESHEYLRSLWKYGSMAVVPCGHCKLAMHWRNLIFCVENGINYAADGAVHGNEYFAEQNPKILMPALVDLYGSFGITLMHPVYEEGLNTEEQLFELGITDARRIKRTSKDKQIVCSQHIMFAAFMRKYLANHSFEEYETNSATHLRTKVELIQELTKEHFDHPEKTSLLSTLIG